jgi:hypothetical protein
LKPTISKHGQYWRLLYYRPQPGTLGLVATSEFFIFYDGAIGKLTKIGKQIKQEQKALRYLKEIELTLLSVREYHFIVHMDASKCKNITRRQYGFLKGIWERQR